jgi:hypothetical protein
MIPDEWMARRIVIGLIVGVVLVLVRIAAWRLTS